MVSGVTNSTVSLALIAVRRGFRNILDLGAGCGGVVCHGRRVRPGRGA
jgi:hypothetical protein